MSPERATTRAPRSPRVTEAKTTLLYARPGIIVTVDRFTVGRNTFRVAELTHLRSTRGPHDRIAVRAVATSGVAIGGVGVLLGFTGGLQRLTAGAYLILGAVLLVPALIAVAGDRWRPPAYELWGLYRGDEVLLFSADEERQFGQVTRALVRAREMNRYGGWNEPLASVDPWRPSR
ncbi:DUF6232 family protein [Micromonospora sp. WMMD812]|uniref:DUF6232 family protein n=1 Tax=Micromonospora sp. WMMD812 TaxID=3015152 RepID=UPI00248C0105|nr:DUF6232 family protein [Micromonospora sp. WMMD812]WBB66788.1 DUF6232 family protein [Micromonospora sp. WMMD812]